VIGDQSFATCQKVGQAIARGAKGKNVLLVASTDLSHFHSYDRAVKIDQVLLEDIRAYDPEKLQQDLQEEKAEACGGGPVIAVMIASRELGANESRVLSYRNSGDVTGDRPGSSVCRRRFLPKPRRSGKGGARKGRHQLGLQERKRRPSGGSPWRHRRKVERGSERPRRKSLGSNLQENGRVRLPA